MAAISNSVGSSNNAGTLGQGIDVQALVTASLAGDQANITQLQNHQSTFTSQITALQKITAEITTLQSAAFALGDPLGGINALTISSSNTSVLSATAASTAVAGTHTVTVTSLATTSSYYSDAVASSSTPLAQGTGAIQISVGSNTPVPIDITSATNTLAGLASTINNTPNIGVTASVITDANGARLALVSNTSGAPGNLSVTGTLNLTDVNNTAVNFHQAVLGINSSLTVDGVPVSTTANTVSGVLNGVTLNLAGAAPNSPVTITIAPDLSKASDAVNQFVSAYNAVITDVNAQFAVNSDGSGGGPLEADGSAREAQSTLLSALTSAISGNNGIGSLAALGVNLNNDGTLTVDSTKLNATLSTQSANVQAFLQAPSTGFASKFASALSNLIDPGNGVLGLDSKGIQASSQALSQQISDLQAALAVKQQNLIFVYSQVNATLQELPLLQAQLNQQLASA
jgi:flagellar hook-associated protein 2